MEGMCRLSYLVTAIGSAAGDSRDDQIPGEDERQDNAVGVIHRSSWYNVTFPCDPSQSTKRLGGALQPYDHVVTA